MRPFVYVVMSNKKTALYVQILDYLKREFGIFPKSIMMDFELAMRKAVSIVWPDCVKSGCYFHYVKVNILFNI